MVVFSKSITRRQNYLKTRISVSQSKFDKLLFVVNLIKQATETILVLNSGGGWKSAMLMNLAGGQEESTCFQPDDNTAAHGSCSIKWQNQLFIFGGYSEKRQISKLSGSKLERVGTLPFDHWTGACSVMADRVYLCFNRDDGNLCRRSTGPLEQFSSIAFSTHDHRNTRTSCSDSKFFVFYWHS